MRFLLDTHILIWWLLDPARLNPAQQATLAQASPANPLLLSEISLWEVAMLTSLGRLRLALPLREWLDRASAAPLVKRCSITPAVAAQSATLPETFHRDPTDRLIVATALVERATLLSADHKIIQAALVPTL